MLAKELAITDSHFSPAAQQEIAKLEVELVIATEIS